jgi:two-component system CheB/CheR fusion protein
MGDAVVVVDPTGQPHRTNRAYDELVQQLGAAFVPRDDRGEALDEDAWPLVRAGRGETFRQLFNLTTPTGSTRWFEANGQPLESGGVQGGVVVIREITEQTLRLLQEQFMAMAGHELRTPLTSLLGYSQLLLKKAESEAVSAPLLRFANVTVSQASRLKELVDDLMSVTRLESGKLELNLAPVDLVGLASHAIETAQVVAQGQTIHLDAPDEPVVVNGDAPRLEDVLLNLLTNAIKYAQDTERIEVRVRRREEQAEISVEDFGPGIASAALPHIFSRFYQVTRSTRPSQSGLGLGLFIVQETVTAHGGSVEVRPGDRAGTIFTVRLPLVEEGTRPA